jgi:hypothetical protein
MDPAYMGAIFENLNEKVRPERRQDTPREALCLRFVDATIISLSSKLMHFGLVRTTGQLYEKGESRRDVKAVFSLTDEGLPSFLRLCKEQKECSDCEALGEAIKEHAAPGDLWVFDRGLNDRERLLALFEAGAFFLAPRNQQALRVQRTLYSKEEEAPTQHSNAEEAPTRPPEGDALFRLARVEEAYFGNGTDVTVTHRRLKWEKMPLVVLVGWLYDRRNRQWKEWTLLSSLPLSEDGSRAGPYTFVELADLYRRRWEIETFFKFLKQRLGYEHLTSRCENGIRVMIYAAMIAALLMIWFKKESGIDRGWKAVKIWLAENLRTWTSELIQQDLLPP